MKSKILYALASALFSLAIVAFMAFKNKQDAEGKYAVVRVAVFEHEITFAYANGNNEHEKFEKKIDIAAVEVKAITKMDSEGYDLVKTTSYVEGGVCDVTFIFKKR